jgi:hypothetical protein
MIFVGGCFVGLSSIFQNIILSLYVWKDGSLTIKKGKIVKTHLQMREVFIYPPTKTYCSVKHLQVLSFFILPLVSTCLVDQTLTSFKFFHIATCVHLSCWSSRMAAMHQQNMTHGLEALILHDGLAMTVQIDNTWPRGTHPVWRLGNDHSNCWLTSD